MTFNNEYDLGDIISIVSIVLAIIGAAFGFYQWKKSIRIKRAEYIEKLTEKIRTDNDIKEMVYTLDYGHLWYTSAFHNSGELERKMDKTLSYFSYICYLYKSRLISKKEFAIFKYEIERILTNDQVNKYFYNLYHFAKKFKTPMTFSFLFEYGEKHNKFEKDFYDKNSPKYKKSIKWSPCQDHGLRKMREHWRRQF